MDTEALPTYYPGDDVRLKMEIQHVANFREVTAHLRIRPDRVGAVAYHRPLGSRGIETLQAGLDGTKTSTVEFETTHDFDEAGGGAVYELEQVTGETVGGRHCVFDVSKINLPRFRFSEEPYEGLAVVSHADSERA